MDYFKSYNIDIQPIVNILILVTPLFSYGLTSYQIYTKKNSNGFSIDVCLIMLISSIVKVIYYLLEPYEISLLRQAVIMIFIQCVLLKTALVYYTSPTKLYETEKILTQSSNSLDVLFNNLKFFDNAYVRPFNFWQWFDNHFKFWEFLVEFSIALLVFSIIFKDSLIFINIIGVFGLFTESILPLPQILLIYRLKSVKNFKWILLVSWLCGDTLKIAYLLFGTTKVSNIFIFAAFFQASLDLFIVGQFFHYRKLDILPK